MKSENNEEIIEEPIIIDEIDIEAKRVEAIDRAKRATHNWKQRGVWIECDSCDFPHGFSIGPNKKLTGIDESGRPIIA